MLHACDAHRRVFFVKKVLYIVCAVRQSPAWLPLCEYEARFHFIEHFRFRAQADQRSSLTCHWRTQLRLSVPRGAPLEVTTSRALLGHGISINFPRSDSSALHIPLEPGDPQRAYRVLQ